MLKFSKNGKVIAVGFDNGEVRLYEIKIFEHQFGKI